MSAFHENSAGAQNAVQSAPAIVLQAVNDSPASTLFPWLMSAYGMAAAIAYREILRFLIMARVLGC